MAKTKDNPAKGRAARPPAEEVTAPDKGRADWWMGKDGAPFSSGDDYIATRGEYLSKSVFTQKTQELASERRALDAERQRFDLDRREKQQFFDALDAKAKKFEAFDRLVKERPDVYRELERKLQAGPGPDAIQERMEAAFAEKYGSQLDELKQWKEEQESSRRRTEVFESLKSRYPDFDGDATEKDIAELQAKLQSGDMGYLAERLHLSRSGLMSQKTPSDIEDATEDNDDYAELMPEFGDAPPADDQPAYMSIAEAEERAMRDLSGM